MQTRWGDLPIEEDPDQPGRYRVKPRPVSAASASQPAVARAMRMAALRFRYRSQLEAAYAEYLEGLQHMGAIHEWMYEPFRLRLATRTWYKPDFGLWLPDGTIEIHEVKGFMREDANVKLKVAVERYSWFRWRLVMRRKGEWISRLLP